MAKLFKLTVAVISLVLFLGAAAWARDKAVVAVLPFSVHSAENIDYVQQGIWDMLITRISSDKITVTAKDAVLAHLQEMGKKELALADVYGLGKKINADFVVWGSITKIGNNVSIDGKLVDIGTYKSPVGIFAQSQGLDEIIPKINDFAQRMGNHILGGSGESIPSVAPSLPAPSPQATREREIIAGMKASKRGTFTAIPINPDFINSPQTPQALNAKSFWMSPQLALEIKGMDIGDVNNDGLNEVVAIDSRNIFIYQKKEGDFKLLRQIPGDKNNNYLSVDVADTNNNGIKEIIVSNMVGTELYSFVLEWREGKFTPLATKLPWMLRVIKDASGSPLLLGQKFGWETTLTWETTFESPIYEIVWDGAKYREGKKTKIPLGLSIFGVTLDTLDERGAEKVIAFDDVGRLIIYEKTDKPLSRIHVLGGSTEVIWKSEEPFGGSNNSFLPYGAVRDENDQSIRAYANLRILSYDTNKDGKKEFILVKNISATGTAFKASRFYTSSEIYNMEWDGMGLAENWKTKKINGYIADYQIKDIDNDGQNDLVLAVVLSTGFNLQGKSALVAYKLGSPEGDSKRQ